jgi:hypothetical protein
MVRNDQISVYYDENWLAEHGLSAEIAMLKIQILNGKNTNGVTRITPLFENGQGMFPFLT